VASGRVAIGTSGGPKCCESREQLSRLIIGENRPEGDQIVNNLHLVWVQNRVGRAEEAGLARWRERVDSQSGWGWCSPAEADSRPVDMRWWATQHPQPTQTLSQPWATTATNHPTSVPDRLSFPEPISSAQFGRHNYLAPPIPGTPVISV